MSWQPSNDPVLGDPLSCDALELVIVPRTATSAMDSRCAARCRTASVRWSVPHLLRSFRPVQFLSGKGMDVRPHRISGLHRHYLFDGSIMHRDSEGNIQEIQPGAMNLMTAGRGIAHSERTPDVQRRDGQKMLGLQSWMHCAGSEESRHRSSIMPPRACRRSGITGLTARIIAGSSFGATSPVAMVSPWFYTEVAATQGTSVPLIPITKSRDLSGGWRNRDRRRALRRAAAADFRPGDRITVKALKSTR